MATTYYITVWVPVRRPLSNLEKGLSAALVQYNYPPQPEDDETAVGFLKTIVTQLLRSKDHGVTSFYPEDDGAYSLLTFGSQIHGHVGNGDLKALKVLHGSLVESGAIDARESLRVIVSSEDWDDDPEKMLPGWHYSVWANSVYDHLEQKELG